MSTLLIIIIIIILSVNSTEIKDNNESFDLYETLFYQKYEHTVQNFIFVFYIHVLVLNNHYLNCN